MVTLCQIATAAIATSIVTAAPAMIPRDDEKYIEWKEGDTHNIDVYLSDTRFPWGHSHPSDRMGDLKDECNDLSCSDKTTSYESMTISSTNFWVPTDITLKATGQFSKRTEESSRDALFEIALDAAYKAMKKDEGVKGTSDADCSMITGSCDSSKIIRGELQLALTNYTGIDVKYYDQFYAPNEVTVQVRNSDDDGAISWLTITAEIDDDDSGEQACSSILGAAGAIAGTISGVGGGVFGLGTLFCGSAD
jgi:hypothetical protein